MSIQNIDSGVHAKLAVKMHSLDIACANIECPNRSSQGDFSIVHLGNGPIVQGHRGVTLLLCRPCATAIQNELNGGTSSE